MANPFADRFREAAFTLEETNIPEIAEMLHIAAREIERQEDLLTKAQRPTAADMAKQITAQAPRIPTHCCPACGALWIEYTDSWSLWSMTCGKCCDNPPEPPTLIKVRPGWSQSDAGAKHE